MKKAWWRSKTLWVNAVALIASLLQLKFGLIIDPATQGVILTIVNLILRAVTNEPVGLHEETT